jgi:hypothetical protein
VRLVSSVVGSNVRRAWLLVGVTLFEMLAVLVVLACGVCGALIGGFVAGGVGGVLGFVAGFAGPPTLIALVVAVDNLLFAGPPLDPVRCPCGELACRLAPHPAHGWVQTCVCARMLVRRRGRIFLVGQSGALVPFRRWHFVRGWVLVTSRDAAAAPYR